MHTTDLLGSGEASGKAAAFGVLGQHDQGEKTTDDEDDDGDGDHGEHAAERRWCFDYLFS